MATTVYTLRLINIGGKMDTIYLKLTFFNLLSFIVFAYKNVGNEGVRPRFSPIQAVSLSHEAVG